MLKTMTFFVYGVIFGFSCIIPGVGGDTMLVALGCYDTVIDLPALDFKSVKNNQGFLIPFGVGFLAGIVLFSVCASFLLQQFPLALYLFFIGLVIGSIPVVYRCIIKTDKFHPSCLVPLLIFIAVPVILGISEQEADEAYALKQSALADNPSVTVVKMTNLSRQTISNWIIEFEEGAVIGAGGVELTHKESLMSNIISLFGEKTDGDANAFIPASSNKPETIKIEPNASVTFTYIAKDGKNLKLTPRLSYKMGFNLFLTLLLGGFIAAFAVPVPGVSGSYVLTLFGVNSTVTNALSDMNFLVLLPTAIGFIFGIYLSAKLIKRLLSYYRVTVYSAIMGLMLGSVYGMFPLEHMSFGTPFAIGIAALIIGCALSLTVSMERISNEDLKKTSKNL